MILKQNTLLRNTALILLTTICLLIRLLSIPQNMDWNDDISSSQLIAKLIVEEKYLGVKTGHWNSGLYLNYPPYYYYLQALIRTINNTYEWSMCILIFLHLLAAISVYQITKIYSTRVYGVFAVCLFLISPFQIKATSSVWMSNFTLPIALISLGLFVTSLNNNSTKILLFSVFLTSFTTTLQYSATLQLILIIIIMWFSLKTKWLKFYFTVFCFITFAVFWLPVIKEVGMTDFIIRNVKLLFGGNNPLGIDYLNKIDLKEVIYYISPQLNPIYTLFYLTISYFLYLFSKNSGKVIVTIFLIFFLLSIIFSIYTRTIHYGLFQYPLLFCLIGIFAYAMIEYRSVFIKFFGIIFLLYFFISFFPKEDVIKLRSNETSIYQKIKEVSKITNNNGGSLILILSNYENRPEYWNSLNIWYFDSYQNHHYSILPKNICSVEISDICFDIFPENIILLCPEENSYISWLLNNRYIHQDVCLDEYYKINDIVGLSCHIPIKLSDEIFSLDVNKIRNNKTTKPII